MEELETLCFWKEPMEIFEYGISFVENATKFIQEYAEKAKTDETVLEDLGLSLRAFVGFAVKSGSSDTLIQGLSLVSEVEGALQGKPSYKKVFDQVRTHLKTYLDLIHDEYIRRNNSKYLNANDTSGVFSIAKFVSFS
jgi:hypothetical protein